MHRITKAQHQPKAKEKHRKKLKLKTRDSLLITNKAIEAQGKLQMNTDLQVERVIKWCAAGVCLQSCSDFLFSRLVRE